MPVPPSLQWLSEFTAGRAWLARLDDLVAEAAERWGLEVGPVYAGAHVSFACPAQTADGDDVVLKVQYPHEECRFEADALRAWGGRGAVRLLAHDAGSWTLLLERCDPGHVLAGAGLDVIETADVMGGLTEASWVDPPAGHPFRSLRTEADTWIATMPAAWDEAGRPFPDERLELGMDCLREVVDDQGPAVLLNQDLHDDNVLAARRAPWLVIDPKPLVGERSMSMAPILRSVGYRHGPDAALVALDRMCALLGLDEGRVLRWTIGQSVAWGLDSSASIAPRHVATVDALVGRLRSWS